MNDVKQQLLKRQAELKKRLTSIKSDVRHENEPLSSDWQEQATERQNDEVLDALGNAARKELRQIVKALKRLEAGDYFSCSSCGEDIGEDRLKLLPYTELCVRCAQKQESDLGK